MEKPRVLHVLLSLEPGGTQRLVLDLCRQLMPVAEMRICCLDDRGDWAAEAEAIGVVVDELYRGAGFRPSLALRIAELVDAHRADVIHCHHYSPFVYSALAVRLRRTPRLVYTEHGRITDKPPSLKRRLANMAFARVPGTFCAVSNELRAFMVKEGFSPARVNVVYNGVPIGPPPGPDARSAARHRLGLATEAFVVGTVARLDPVKDLTTLLHGFAELSKHHPDVVLAVIGDGPERAGLERTAREAGIGRTACFLGWHENARDLLTAFDVYANTSITEGISVTILEAMAAGVPVVATDVGGTPEIIDEGDSGLLVGPRHAQSLARALKQLAASSELRDRLVAGGRRRIQERFSLTAMVDSYFRAYQGAAD